MRKKIAVLLVVAMAMSINAFAMCGMCEEDGKEESHGAKMKDGVKEITYDQFVGMRNSGEKYILLDVLSADSFTKGHIEGAASFPFDIINAETAGKKLSKDDHIIVYCGSFQCAASTEAAKQLSGLGYNVLDYKGGLKEWQEKGNKLAITP